MSYTKYFFRCIKNNYALLATQEISSGSVPFLKANKLQKHLLSNIWRCSLIFLYENKTFAFEYHNNRDKTMYK